ncbi:PAS domain-containing protein [Paenibacillus thiaminolyticus]|uniref:helix-turn-helix transcriptional regulator n=1 Tax=Paenibacillus thiaminolyticus TaxID=49283 RepID=UPI00232C7FC0|nr:PAS domain-containing protein [Paenibacillus thiaminolyticus]WCF09813.1 PAS domain-containing protein [Paenibacillus thiaminolyticus]
MDNELFRHYQNIMNYFGEILGANYEFVLHVLNPNEGSRIGHIVNGELSGRALNGPLTNYAKKLINEKVYLNKDYVVDYVGEGPRGKKFRSSTLFIKDREGQLQGLLCINFDADAYRKVAKDILKLANLSSDIELIEQETDREQPIEKLTDNIRNIIYAVVDKDILESGAQLSPEQKRLAISKLKEYGVFEVKGTINEVADIMGMSESSVYRYLQMISRERQIAPFEPEP